MDLCLVICDGGSKAMEVVPGLFAPLVLGWKGCQHRPILDTLYMDAIVATSSSVYHTNGPLYFLLVVVVVVLK